MQSTRKKIKLLLSEPPTDQEVTAKGWVRTRRGSKNVAFIALNDGSTIKNLQVVADLQTIPEGVMSAVTTGACLAVSGKLVASQGQGQSVELQATTIEVLGAADPRGVPIAAQKTFVRVFARHCPPTSAHHHLRSDLSVAPRDELRHSSILPRAGFPQCAHAHYHRHRRRRSGRNVSRHHPAAWPTRRLPKTGQSGFQKRISSAEKPT